MVCGAWPFLTPCAVLQNKGKEMHESGELQEWMDQLTTTSLTFGMVRDGPGL
jgi:hypothetical protein